MDISELFPSGPIHNEERQIGDPFLSDALLSRPLLSQLT
jgi:hypothetical protein